MKIFHGCHIINVFYDYNVSLKFHCFSKTLFFKKQMLKLKVPVLLIQKRTSISKVLDFGSCGGCTVPRNGGQSGFTVSRNRGQSRFTVPGKE